MTKFSDEQIELLRRWAESPTFFLLIQECIDQVTMEFRHETDLDGRIKLAAELDAFDRFMRRISAVIDDVEFESVSNQS